MVTLKIQDTTSPGEKVVCDWKGGGHILYPKLSGTDKAIFFSYHPLNNIHHIHSLECMKCFKSLIKEHIRGIFDSLKKENSRWKLSTPPRN